MNSTATVATATATRLACAQHSSLFLHPLLEDAPAALTAEAKRRRARLANQASALCAACPVRRQCLYNAVVRFDVAGLVAGTTPAMRAATRQRLGWKVEPENFDALLGIAAGQHVNHDDVVRARRANPQESLVQLADRLGCSLSTVKRHLRQERAATRPTGPVVPPSPEQVEQALHDVLATRRPLATAA